MEMRQKNQYIIGVLILNLLRLSTAYAQSTDEPASDNFINLSEKETDLEWGSKPKFPTGSETKKIIIDEILEPQFHYNYSSFGTPDPFKKPDWSTTNPDLENIDEDYVDSDASQNGAEIPVISELQKFPLKDLQIKGIWLRADGTKKVLIMTPSKTGVIAGVGSPISAGKVVDIMKNYIVVRQYEINKEGARIYEDKELFMEGSTIEPKAVVKLVPGEPPIFEGTDTNSTDQMDKAPLADTGAEVSVNPEEKKQGANENNDFLGKPILGKKEDQPQNIKTILEKEDKQ